MQCHAVYGTVHAQPFMTDTIVPSETQTLHCIYCTLQLTSNPDLPWTFQNLHGRPQFEATLTPLDQYRTCILLMHTPHNHTHVHINNGPPPTSKEQEQVLEKSFKNESTEVHNPWRDVVKYSMSLASRIRYQWYVLYCMGCRLSKQLCCHWCK